MAAIAILGQIGYMKITSVTIGMLAQNIVAGADWYQRVFELDAPDLRPADGVIEFEVGSIWLQLLERPETRTATS